MSLGVRREIVFVFLKSLKIVSIKRQEIEKMVKIFVDKNLLKFFLSTENTIELHKQ
jgi:hypothetical protein